MARDIIYPGKDGNTSRMQQFAQMNLGVKYLGQNAAASVKVFRKSVLDLYDAYFENRQYDDKRDWFSCEKQEDYIPIRDRKPHKIYNVAKLVTNKVAAKMAGRKTFPKFVIEDDPDDSEFINTVLKASNFRKNLIEPLRRSFVSGSSFVRYYLVNGQIEMEYALSKFCYPVFDPVGELEQIEIKYIYADDQDLDANKEPRLKWYRLMLTKTADILFDNPYYVQGADAEFKEVERNDHGLGWVQGEWFSTAKDKFNPDGPSLFADVLGFIDDLNYSLSQSSQAVSYNQDPQLTVKGVDEEELDTLIRSSSKAWNLGRAGEAKFIESALSGVTEARETRADDRNRMLEVIRIVINDPEKIVGSAMSGKAMEILCEPLVELIDELRTVYEDKIRNLLLKIALTCLVQNAQGNQTVIETPPGYQPSSLDVTVQWPDIFPPTIDDIAKMTTTAVAAATGMLISRETLTKYLAPLFGIENVEEELAKIAAQPPPPSPFGDFGGGM
jgi:hypothetical protein